MTQAQFITGQWAHIFEGERHDRNTRIVLDAHSQKLVSAHVQRNMAINDSYTPASRDEIADIEDSLVNANGELFDNPNDYGLEYANTLPVWAA
ncbi:hypothetical protein RYA05_01900 [Pseudomonas syringae pv. actinidiae]|nr:hypothetical protein [Pseudomonas syringae pv. actinidiae]